MTRPFQITSIHIFSGQAVSSPVPILGASDMAVQAPNSVAGTLSFQVAHDTTSASFVDAVSLQSASGAFVWPVAGGARALVVTPLIAGFGYLRLSSSSSQVADRLFLLHSRNR